MSIAGTGIAAGANLHLGAEAFVALQGGALWHPARTALLVADLHLEKGTSFARAGHLLPPYDTRATLTRLKALIDRLQPQAVYCLGDSLHDRRAADRLLAPDRALLDELMAHGGWCWITGNHDPDLPDWLKGERVAEARLGDIVLRHEPSAALGGMELEIAGHLHPKATVPLRGTAISGRCFIENGRRLVLPAFGQYTGGLNVFADPFRALFATRFHAHVIGRERLFTFPSDRLARAA
ncbi:ligase-associated DNA damage response endonuclease PdeM [Radicibacter daui]|uniref:ligase-associated DNA damage response endonuclease PdeM n=1 Tax=Radicibacter daui TaxID=3064829 RepID=UPI004046A859